MVYTILTIGVVIAAILLIIIVLVQNSKGGGLSASLSSSNQILGVHKTTEMIEKLTWGLAATMVALCILTTAFIPREAAQQSAVTGIEMAAPNATPGFDAAAAGEETPVATPEAATDSAQ